MLKDLSLNKIYNMDCFEGIKNIPDNSVDLIVTDPPYNIGDDVKSTKQGNNIISTKLAWGEWDCFEKEEYDLFFINYLKECYRILKDGGTIYCFSARKDNGFFIREAVKIGFKYLNSLVIIKDNPLPHFNKTNWRSSFELCFYACKGDKPKTFNFLSQNQMINKYNYLIGKKYTNHPTEKPLEFIKLLIKVNSNENDVVFDGFMGSGTTAVASKQLNRNFIGFEISKEYLKMSNNRLNQNTLIYCNSDQKTLGGI